MASPIYGNGNVYTASAVNPVSCVTTDGGTSTWQYYTTENPGVSVDIPEGANRLRLIKNCTRVLIYEDVIHNGTEYILNTPYMVLDYGFDAGTPTTNDTPYVTDAWDYYGDGVTYITMGQIAPTGFGVDPVRLYDNLIVADGFSVPPRAVHTISLKCDSWALAAGGLFDGEEDEYFGGASIIAKANTNITPSIYWDGTEPPTPPVDPKYILTNADGYFISPTNSNRYFISTATTSATPIASDYTYEDSSTYPGYIVITGYTGDGGNITIPETIDGKTVIGIGNEAFYGNQNITDITVPDTVLDIGNNAFSSMGYLNNITIGRGVTACTDGSGNYWWLAWPGELQESFDSITFLGNLPDLGLAFGEEGIPWSGDVTLYFYCSSTGFTAPTITNGWGGEGTIASEAIDGPCPYGLGVAPAPIVFGYTCSAL